MIGNEKVYAIIPAREGSKRLPGKNIRNLAGKPMIAYSIEEALKSSYIDRIIVSTDSEKIASVSKEYGADVPFLRPENLSTDKATPYDYINHLIEFLKLKGNLIPDIILILQPTSPLRIKEDIDGALESLIKKGHNSIVSVYVSPKSPFWYKTVDQNGCVKNVITRKDIKTDENFYILNGAIYAFYTDFFLKNKVIIGEETLAYIMPPERSVDVDIDMEFKLAESILRGNNVD